MNTLDIILTILIVIAVVLAVTIMIRAKKQGKSCCGDCLKCGGCSYTEGRACRK